MVFIRLSHVPTTTEIRTAVARVVPREEELCRVAARDPCRLDVTRRSFAPLNPHLSDLDHGVCGYPPCQSRGESFRLRFSVFDAGLLGGSRRRHHASF